LGEWKTLTYKKIFKFWSPLSATWLMMSVEGPLIAAIIARMAEPKINLAAYGVAFAFALIIEAPVIMMLSASTALVKDVPSYLKLRRFTQILNISITGLMFVLLWPAVFNFILAQEMQLPILVLERVHPALIILLVWPAAIGYRRFYQGILIRYGFTRRVAYGTVIRLSVMSTIVFLFFFLDIIPGALVGAAALSSGVFAEAVASRLMARQALKMVGLQPIVSADISHKSIVKFYYPLALTSLLGLVIQPALTFFMGQAPFALESLAVWPVVNSFVFIFRSFGLSFQEVAISLLDEQGKTYLKLRKFARWMAVIVSALLGIIAFSPLLNIWLQTVSGLSSDLAGFAYMPIRILALMPALAVWLSFQRAVLVSQNSTSPITMATAIEVVSILILMLYLTMHLNWNGAAAAATALMVGRVGSNSYLWTKIIKARTNFAECVH